MSDNSRWPAEWNELVDSVNQDPNIEASENTDASGAKSVLKNLTTKEKFTAFISGDSAHSGRVYYVYDDNYTKPVGHGPKSNRRRTQTYTLEDIIQKFYDSYNGSSQTDMQESRKPIKLKSLVEGYAWERKPGKGLPTLSEVQAEYERNTNEAADKVSSRTHVVYSCNVELADGSIKPGVRISVPKGNNAEQQVRDKIMDRFGKDCKIRSIVKGQNPQNNDNDKKRWQDSDGDGKWYEKGDDVNEDFEGGYGGNKRRRWDDTKGYNRGEWDDTHKFKQGADVEAQWPAEWNELVDSVNQDPNIEASEEIDYRAAISRLKNIETGEVWELIQPQQGNMYVAYRPEGRMSDYSVKTLEDLIASFKGVKQESVNLTENMRRFGTKNI